MKYAIFDASSKLKLSPSPLKLDGWKHLLKHYPIQGEFLSFVPAKGKKGDNEQRETYIEEDLVPGPLGEIIAGIIEFGCRIGYEGPERLLLAENMASAEDDPETMEIKLKSDLKLRRVLPCPPLRPFVSSPLGFIPKTDGTFRKIHNLSAPAGRSTNDGIPEEYRSIGYPYFEDIVAAILQTGVGCYVVKKDLKDAFRIIPVSRLDQWLLGFKWAGHFYRETCLPFGLATAPFLFNLLAEALHWILISYPGLGVEELLHYLDDFIFIFRAGPDLMKRVAHFHKQYNLVTDMLGVPRNEKKDCEGQVIEILGIEYDTLRHIARLSKEKLEKARAGTASLLAKESVALEEIRSVVGFLSFCSKVVKLGKVYMPYLYAFLGSYPPNAHKTMKKRLNQTVKTDLLWWNALLPRYNGVYYFNDRKRTNIQLFTDASKEGMGGFFMETSDKNWKNWCKAIPETQAFSAKVAHNGSEVFDINLFELGAISLAFDKFASQWRSKRVFVHTDSAISQTGIEKSTLKGDANAVLRKILLRAAEHDIEVIPIWVAGKDNELADAISRFKYNEMANWCSHWQTSYKSLLLREIGYDRMEITCLH